MSFWFTLVQYISYFTWSSNQFYEFIKKSYITMMTQNMDTIKIYNLIWKIFQYFEYLLKCKKNNFWLCSEIFIKELAMQHDFLFTTTEHQGKWGMHTPLHYNFPILFPIRNPCYETHKVLKTHPEVFLLGLRFLHFWRHFVTVHCLVTSLPTVVTCDYQLLSILLLNICSW